MILYLVLIYGLKLAFLALCASDCLEPSQSVSPELWAQHVTQLFKGEKMVGFNQKKPPSPAMSGVDYPAYDENVKNVQSSEFEFENSP